MSNRKSVNLTKLKQKADQKQQGTISKFFRTNLKCDSKSKTEDIITIIDDSPEKKCFTITDKNKSPSSKKRRQSDQDENSSVKRKCIPDIKSGSLTPSLVKNSQDLCMDEQQPCCSKYIVSDTTKMKLKQFECEENDGEGRIINLKPVTKNRALSETTDICNQSSDRPQAIDSDYSDDGDDVIVDQSRFSKFSRPFHSQNMTSVKGKSPLINKPTKTKYTPLEQQYLDIKNKYPDALLLVECGYRYRMFGEDAENAAKVLKIFSHPDHNFQTASIPTHRLFVHVRRLVSAGYKVGVVKQTETAALKAAGDNKSAPFSRELHSLYTKSTLIGEDVNPLSGEITEEVSAEDQTSFLLCVTEVLQNKNKETCIGVLAVQPSTGDIIYDCFTDNDMRSELETRITHIQPAEILVPCDLSEQTEKCILGIIDISNTDDDRIRLERQKDEHFDYDEAFKNVTEFFKSDTKCASRLQEIINLPRPVISCFSAILVYLKDFGLSSALKLTSNICQFSTKSLYMQLQSNVLRNLEVFQNLTDGRERGSLFWAINQTTTKFGARMLKSWLKNPLLSARQILARQEAVNELIDGDCCQVLNQLRSSLSQTPDLEKGISSIFYKKCSVLEFFLVCKSLIKWCEEVKTLSKQLEGRLSSELLNEILTDVPNLLADVKSLLNNICENNVRDKDKSCLFTDDSLFPEVQQRKLEIEDVQKQMIVHRRTVRLTLKQPALDYVTVMGTEYLVEVKNNILHVVPKDWFKVSSTKAVSRFHPPFIQATYKRLNQLREQLKKDCNEAWLQFLGWFVDDYQRYRKAVHHIATLDCLFSLASVARLPGYCLPRIFDDEVCINIKQGRHPVIQQILHGDQQYVPNDTHLSSDGKRVMIITGPNMGGKSSYIKQVALISILTQIGSYVPAESAEMGILDAIFTRMGASDEIYKGRSTFMVELSEASDIMLKATPRSLVILDELGRGTSTHDGVAIAYATLDYFINSIGCLTLFVTHYTMLSELESNHQDTVGNYHMSFMVNNDDHDSDENSSDVVTFLYQLVQGSAGKSYGLNVARLASIPQEILSKAAKKSLELQNVLREKRDRETLFKKLFLDDYYKLPS